MHKAGELWVPASVNDEAWNASKPVSSPKQKPVFCFSIIQKQQSGTCRGGAVSGSKQHKTQILYPSKRKRNLSCGNWVQNCSPMQGWLEPSGGIIFHLHLFQEVCNGKKLSVMVFYRSSSCPPLNPLITSLCSCSPYRFLLEPGGKGLKRVRWRICCGFAAWKAPRQTTALLLCCSGLTALSPWGPELQVCPAHCPFQWFWVLHLTKKAALKWFSIFLQSALYQPDIDCGMQRLLPIVKWNTLFWKNYTMTFSF